MGSFCRRADLLGATWARFPTMLRLGLLAAAVALAAAELPCEIKAGDIPAICKSPDVQVICTQCGPRLFADTVSKLNPDPAKPTVPCDFDIGACTRNLLPVFVNGGFNAGAAFQCNRTKAAEDVLPLFQCVGQKPSVATFQNRLFAGVPEG